MNGPFRLIPPGYAQALDHTAVPELAGRVEHARLTDDQTIVRRSSLCREPRYAPAGYTLKRIDGWGKGNAEDGVALAYEGPGHPIQVRHERIAQTPVDVGLAPPDSPEISEQGQIQGSPAIFEYPKPFFKEGPVRVIWVRNGVLTVISGINGNGVSLSELQKMAESLP